MRTDDGYIIQKCLDGDSTAFGLLVDKYKKSIYALAYSRIHNFHDAQDVTQEVFTKAYKDLHTLKRWDSFMGWLYRVTINLCKNWQRSESRRPDREFTEDQDPIILDKPSVSIYKQNKIYESIQEALNSLPEMYHEVLALHYLEDMSIKDMSKFLGISPRTIDRRLNEARIKLKEEMIAMMSIEYKQHGLPANFTFQIVEIVKRIKINPISKIGGLPWGLSLATGVLIAFLGSGLHLNISNPLAYIMNSANAGKTSAIENGEIPVNVMDVSNKPIFAGNQGKGGEPKQPDMQNAFFMAPQGEGGTWAKKADMPTARMNCGACIVNGKIYAIGGWTNANVLATMEEYDPDKDEWNTKSSMKIPRGVLATVAVNGKIYAIGGENQDGAKFSTVEEYDPTNDTWTTKSNMPTARTDLCASVVNGKIYAIGGRPGGEYTSIVEEYDPTTDTWTRKADMPTARGISAACAVNSKIYVIGGLKVLLFAPGNPVLSTVEEYDPATDKWTKKADMPTARCFLSADAVNDKIYAIGGIAVEMGPGEITVPTVEIYDPSTNIWTKGPDMPTKRSSLSVVSGDGKLYVIGGSVISGGASGPVMATVEEYTPEGWQSVVSSQGRIATKWGQVRQSK